jgi:hypothetical protein
MSKENKSPMVSTEREKLRNIQEIIYAVFSGKMSEEDGLKKIREMVGLGK